MIYKFFGKPNQEVNSKITGRLVFKFDKKGEFLTDDIEIIQRAKGYFDHIKYETKEIANESQEIIEEDTEEEKKVYSCKHCDYETNNKGELLAHYRTHKK